MPEFEINFVIEFVSGDNTESYFPGEDKLWLTTYLDEVPYGYGDWERWTVEGAGVELPLSFLALGEEGRRSFVAEYMDDAVDNAAWLLDRYEKVWPEVNDYRVKSEIDVMNVIVL